MFGRKKKFTWPTLHSGSGLIVSDEATVPRGMTIRDEVVALRERCNFFQTALRSLAQAFGLDVARFCEKGEVRKAGGLWANGSLLDFRKSNRALKTLFHYLRIDYAEALEGTARPLRTDWDLTERDWPDDDGELKSDHSVVPPLLDDIEMRLRRDVYGQLGELRLMLEHFGECSANGDDALEARITALEKKKGKRK